MFRSTCRLFQIAYEVDLRSLCTVTFWQKVYFLISNTHLNSRLYGIPTWHSNKLTVIDFPIQHSGEFNYSVFYSTIILRLQKFWIENQFGFFNPTFLKLWDCPNPFLINQIKNLNKKQRGQSLLFKLVLLTIAIWQRTILIKVRKPRQRLPQH